MNVVTGADGKARCSWAGSDPLYLAYHDTEWGVPTRDDDRLFEKICLEGFQSGLSWLTILRKRDNFRRAFKSFDIPTVARFTPRTVDTLLLDAGIVRNRAKIEATINNARMCASVMDEFGSLAAYVWRFEPDAASRPKKLDRSALAGLTTSPEAKAMSKDLKRRGWAFVGPTTAYSFMEAMGLVNDHMSKCDVHAEVERARKTFRRPSA